MLALIFSLALVAAACGSDDGDEETATDDTEADEAATDDTEADEAEAEDAAADDAEADDAAAEGDGGASLEGVSITVGSKDFTEQLVLGEMLVLAFENAGAEVTNQVDLGGTQVVREALLAGEINVSPEYNGTGWAEHLARDYEEMAGDDGSVDSEALTEAVREADLEENDIVWLGRSPFNDTYGFATSPDLLDDGAPFTMQSMADYLAANPDAIVCMESEFPDRSDGLVLFEEATGFVIPEEQQTILDTGLIYTQTQDGTDCQFGEVFTTDGRIEGLGLNLVEDPGVMIIYNVSVTMRNDLYEQAPEAFDQIAEDVLGPLEQDVMTELNRLVDIEGQPAAEVAETFMTEQGIIG